MPKRIVHMLNSMGMGGIENFIMNVYREIDREKYQFDFILQCEEESYFEKEIMAMGGRIYKIPRIEKHPIKHMKELKKILSENDFLAFHRHTASSVVFVDLWIAKKCGIDNRIVHSHSTTHERKLFNTLFKPFLNHFASIKLACGEEAGKWLYGKKAFQIVYNGIPTKQYLFSSETRQKIRDQYHLSDKIVIGHVGRFNEVKNHRFLIEVFKKLYSHHTQYLLMLCGGGPLEKEMKELCIQYNLQDAVSFLGIREDVGDIMQAMDLFAFPSLYEGLSLTLIEAQLSGLPIIASSKIPKETFYQEEVSCYPISENDIDTWVKAIEEIACNTEKRNIINDSILKQFDIKNVTNTLINLYEGR